MPLYADKKSTPSQIYDFWLEVKMLMKLNFKNQDKYNIA